MKHLQVATFKSIRDELLANTIETGAVIVQTYIPDVSEDTLCLPYRSYVKSILNEEESIENNERAKGFIISPWSGKSPNPDYVGDQEVLYEDVNFRFKSTFQATNCTISGNSGNTLLLGSSYSATVSVAPGYVLQSVTVTMGGTVVPGYNASTNPNIQIDSVLGDIVITAVAQLITYNIAYNITPTCVESTNTTPTIQHGQNYSTTLQPLTGYQNIGAGNVTVGGTQVDSWGKVASKNISLTDVQGDIEINATCGDLNEYTVSFDSECVNIDNPARTISHGYRYQATLTPATGYTNIGAGQVTVGGQVVQHWNTGESSVSIDLTAIGNIVITVDCGSVLTYSITLESSARSCIQMEADGAVVSGGVITGIPYGTSKTVDLNPISPYINIGSGYITMDGVRQQQYDWNNSPSSYSLTITNITGDIVIYADCGELNKYSITYKYQDTEGNQIHQDDVVTGIESGTTVDVTQKRISIEHYTFDRQNPDGSVVITQDTDVILTYTENPKYDVIVKYVNQSDAEIASRETITGKYAGDKITSVTIKTIENYNYDSSTSTSLPFTVTNDPNQNIIYVKYIYDPDSFTLVAEYVDDLNNPITNIPIPEPQVLAEGTPVSPQQVETWFKEDINGYVYTSGIPSEQFIMNENKTITLVYTKQVTLTVEYQDENGDPIPNQQSETHVYPRGTTLSSSDLAEFIRVIENYTYNSTIPSSVTMNQDQTVVIKYTLDQQCIELDPEFGVQAELMYEGEQSVEITYHTLVGGVPQEVHENYPVSGTPVKDLNPGEDAIYDTLNSLYGEEFKGYIIGTINGCDGDVNFKIYVIHCTENCIEVKMDGCAPWNTEKLPNDTWNTTTFTFSGTPTTGQYGVFNLQNGVRTYRNDHPLDSTVTKYTENMTVYDSNDPSNHVYWIKFGITYDNVNYSYIFIPVCEYYVLTNRSLGAISMSYINDQTPIDYFRKGDNVTIYHATKSVTPSKNYNPDIFYVIKPKAAGSTWFGNVELSRTIDNLQVLQNNAFREDDLLQDSILLKSWETPLKEDTLGIIPLFINDNRSKLTDTDENFTIQINTNVYSNNGWYFITEMSDLHPIFLKAYNSRHYDIYPKFMLDYAQSENDSGYVEMKYYNVDHEETLYFPAMLVNSCKCTTFTGGYNNQILNVNAGLINGNQIYVFPAKSYYDIYTDINGDTMYINKMNGIYESNGLCKPLVGTSIYLVNEFYKYSSSSSNYSYTSQYANNTYIIPFGMNIDDFLPENGDEIVSVYTDDSGENILDLSKNKLSDNAIKNLGSKIDVYIQKINNVNVLCHDIYDLNGDIYLYELDDREQTLPVERCQACYEHKGVTNCIPTVDPLYWHYDTIRDDLGPVTEGSDRHRIEICSYQYNCERYYETCNTVCQSNFEVNILNPCDHNNILATYTSESPTTSFSVYYSDTVDGYSASASQSFSGDCAVDTITENIVAKFTKSESRTVTFEYYYNNQHLPNDDQGDITVSTIKEDGCSEHNTIRFTKYLPSSLRSTYRPIASTTNSYNVFDCSSVSQTAKEVTSVPLTIRIDIDELCTEGVVSSTYYLGPKEQGSPLTKVSDQDWDFEAYVTDPDDTGSFGSNITRDDETVNVCCEHSNIQVTIETTFQSYIDHIITYSSNDSYLGNVFTVKVLKR